MFKFTGNIWPNQIMYMACGQLLGILYTYLDFLTFTSLSLVLLVLFYLFCSSIVINTVIVTAGNFEP